MYLEELIAQLQKTQTTVGGDSKVYIHYEGEEIEAFGISVRIVDIDDYEVVIE